MNAEVLKIGLEDGAEVYVLESLDPDGLSEELLAMAIQNLSASDSIVYSEEYMFTDIGYINSPTAISKLSNYFDNGEFYYCVFQDYWIVSSNVDAIKRILFDYDQENTLGRNVTSRRAIDALVQKANFTLIKNFNFGTELLENKLKPKWKTYLTENAAYKNRLSQFVIQSNSSGNRSIISGEITVNNSQKEKRKFESNLFDPIVVSNVFAEDEIISKPFIVRNHNNAEREQMFQDGSDILYLADLQGEILWKKKIDNAVIGNISQVDYYNNKKLQFLMLTDSLIYLIDRNGNDVEGFPIAHNAGQNLSNLAVIDYDNSKRYRYLLEDMFGNISLTDKKGLVLEGWNQKNFQNKFQLTPFHTRVRGRDCFVVIDYLGNFILLNRRGQNYEGFPLNTGLRLSGDLFLRKDQISVQLK